jgi:hypothetical protein
VVEVLVPRRMEVELEGQEVEVEREQEVEEARHHPQCRRSAAAAELAQSARPSGSLCR